jgi:hypothetical protein
MSSEGFDPMMGFSGVGAVDQLQGGSVPPKPLSREVR